MTKSRLRTKFLRCRSDENKKAYNEQHKPLYKSLEVPQKLIKAILELKTLMTIKNFRK